MRAYLFSVLIVLLTGLFASPTHAQSIDLTGTWDSDLGPVTIVKDGETYTGQYERGRSSVFFSYNPDLDVYQGYWMEDEADEECRNVRPHAFPTGSATTTFWGRLVFDAPDIRDRLQIKWGYCDQGPITRSWNLTFDHNRNPLNSLGWLDYTNWVQSIENDPQSPKEFVSIHPDRSWTCVEQASGGCRFGLTGDENAGLIYSLWRPGNSTKYGASFEQTEPGVYATINNGRPFLTYNYVNETLMASDGWRGGPESSVTYRRVLRQVEKKVTSTAAIGQSNPDGGVPVLTSTYVSESYGPSRGNRPEVSLLIYGENLWGRHLYSILDETGLEIRRLRYVCGQSGTGPEQIVSSDLQCLEGGGSVAGVSIDFIVWPTATPGQKILSFNGGQIPFILKLDGFPAAPAGQSEFLLTALDRPQAPPEPDNGFPRDYSYPYNRDGSRSSGLDRRVLVLHGKNLPDINVTCLTSEDGRITYRRLDVPDVIRDRLHRAAHSMRGTTVPDDEEAVILRATLLPGVQPSAKWLNVAGTQLQWRLFFSDQRGQISFFRDGDTPAHAEDQLFYHGETIRAGILSESEGLPLSGHRLSLYAQARPSEGATENPQRRFLGTIPLTTVNYEYNRSSPIRGNMAQSEPLLVEIKGRAPLLAARGQERIVSLKPGEILRAESASTFAFGAEPVTADIVAAPDRPDIWKNVLAELKRECRVSGDPNASSFPGQQSTTLRTFIFSEMERQNIPVTKGDHAALILIRNEIVLTAIDANNDFEARYINVSDPIDAAEGYWEDAKQRRETRESSFWKRRSVSLSLTAPDGSVIPVIVPMRDILTDSQVASLSNRLRETVPATRERLKRAIAAEIKAQHEQTDDAIERAGAISSCNVEGLVKVAGNRSTSIVNGVLPRLVEWQNDRWVPNRTARRHVRTVYFLGQAVRDQSEYAALDDSVASLVIGAQGGFISASAYLGSAMTTGTTILSASARLGLALDALDIGVFGARGLRNAVRGETDYETAMGLAPVLGDQFVEDADRARSSPWLTLFSMFSTANSIRSGFSTLDELRHINAGQSFLRSGRTIDSLDALQDQEKLNVLAYYRHLKRRRPITLDPDELADQNRLQSLFNTSQTIRNDPAAARAADDIAQSRAADTTELNAQRPAGQIHDDSRALSAPPTGQCEAINADSPRVRQARYDYDPFESETVAVPANPTDPSEMGTEVIPGGFPVPAPDPIDPNIRVVPEVLPPGYGLDGRPWGVRLEERGITEDQIEALIRKGRSGEPLTRDEQLDVADAWGLRKVRERAAKRAKE